MFTLVVARRLAGLGRLARLSTAAVPLYAPSIGEHIHPTAVIEPGARLGNGVSVGPYCVVGNDVVLGDGVRLESHVRVAGHTVVGAGSVVHAFVTLGATPQDLKYAGEPSHLIIGERCRIAEYALLSGGTAIGGGVTSLGDGCFIMSHCHVAHDCHLGHDVLLASNAALAGHVQVGDGARISGYACVQQRVSVGSGAFVGGGSVLAHDLIPHGLAVGNRAQLLSINLRGLRRQHASPAEQRALLSTYRYLFDVTSAGFYEALPTLRQRAECVLADDVSEYPRVRQLLRFVLGQRSVVTQSGSGAEAVPLSHRALCLPPIRTSRGLQDGSS